MVRQRDISCAAYTEFYFVMLETAGVLSPAVFCNLLWLGAAVSQNNKRSLHS
jgi:hypothetical protein